MGKASCFMFRIVFAGLIALSTISPCFAVNPFIHSIYTADPSGHVWGDGRMYVYASHDIDPNQGCDLMDRYHVFSTADMVNWIDEGEILNASQVPWGRPEGGFMWAPDCAYKNGTYYLYFPHPSGSGAAWGSTWKIGIATSTQPASGFTCQGYIAGLESLIDPAVFVDDDGQAYFYYGGGGVCKGGKLKANMTEIDGTMQPMQGLTDFHEATWVHKRNNIYYLSYADNHSDTTGDNRMCYAISNNPLGPWTYKGVVMNPTDSYCAHGSIVEFKGQWYVFYFSSATSKNDWLRVICVDKLNYNSDGTIQLVTQTTSGVPAAGPAAPAQPVLGTYEAENAVLGGGATVADDAAASGKKVVQNLHLTGSFLQFNNVNGGNGGRATIHLYYGSNETAKMKLMVNDTDFSFINTLSSGGWSSYTGHSCLTVPLKAGTANTVKLIGGSGGENVDYITVTGFATVSAQSPNNAKTLSQPSLCLIGVGKDRRLIYSIPVQNKSVSKINLSLFTMQGKCVWQNTVASGFLPGNNSIFLGNSIPPAQGLYLLKMKAVYADGRPSMELTAKINWY